jgi:fumarylpyruvate hydrolase
MVGIRAAARHLPISREQDMTDYAIPLWKTPTLPVAGGGKPFPVRRIYCVGRNYAEHAREMGHDPDREPPFFFTKAADAIFTGKELPYPVETTDVHPECEMIVALAKGGKNIQVENALDCVFGYGVGFDVTRRDMQSVAKDLRRPWSLTKDFDAAAPCSALHPASKVGHIARGTLRFTVNGEVRQESDLDKMIWSVPETIAFLSGLITLLPGDVIMTGTPAGVSAVVKGDTLVGHVDGLTDLTLRIV